MADGNKINFKALTPGEEPLGNIFDLLTPEERLSYSKAYQPSKSETVFGGLHGIADVISSAGGGRDDHYYEKQEQSRTKDRMDQDMQFVGNELTRKYAERQAKAAAEKASRENVAAQADFNQDLPGMYNNPYENLDAAKISYQARMARKLQDAKPKPQGRAPKDLSSFWRLSAKDAINDARIKSLYEQTNGFDDVRSMLDAVKNKNTIAAAGLGKKVATAMGEGARTTDEDVVRYVKSGKLDQALLDKYNKWIEGTPTDATQKEIGEMVAILADKVQRRYAPIYREHSERAAAIQGVPYEEASMKMNLPFVSSQYGWSNKETEKNQTTPTTDSATAAKIARQKELRAKAGIK